MDSLSSPAAAPVTRRFEQKRELIIAAAARLINESGLKGLTLVDVAQAVGLNTTSVTYYFKRKEMLAEAAFEISLSELARTIELAGRTRSAPERSRAFISATMSYLRDKRCNGRPPYANLSEIRAMDEPQRDALMLKYESTVAGLEGFFRGSRRSGGRSVAAMRAHMLVEAMMWTSKWLGLFSANDFDRISDVLGSLMCEGVAVEGAEWSPEPLDLKDADGGGESGREAFLRVASRLINERGYRGASVDRIAAELHVTKGSFYHHLDAKDDLILECFQRSYQRVLDVLDQASALEADGWTKLCSAVSALLAIQFKGDYPLLRSTVLPALPQEHRPLAMERSHRLATRMSGLIVEGVADGSVRPVDPLIASEAVMSLINSACDLNAAGRAVPRGNDLADVYGRAMLFGLSGR